MKAGKWMSMIALLLGFCNILHAAPVGGALVYISPQDYTLLTSVGVDSNQYSFTQGQVVQPIAIAALSPLFADTLMCDAGNESDVVIWIKPSMSYDPIVTLFYGQIVAKVYSGGGRPVGTYSASVEHSGFVDIFPDKQIASTYQAAMRKIVTQMQADPLLQELIQNGLPRSETMVACNMIMLMNGAGQ
jgi:hypothetical protein